MEMQQPDQILNQMIVGSWTTQAIFVAAEMGIADHLAAEPLTAEELGRRTGTHSQSLYRLLRALASIGIFHEDDAGRFSTLPLGRLLASDTPGSKRSLARMAGAEFYGSWAGLIGSVQTGAAAFDGVFGKPFFQYMDAHPDRWHIYDDAMTGIHDAESLPVLEAYDFGALRTVVDVGGGNGFALAAILRRHPEVRGVLFDLPAVAERARGIFAERGLAGRCDFVGGNFFQSLPPDADAYLLRHVLHDWQDADAIAILENCRAALRPGAKALVIENVIPPGNAPCFGKWLDLMMLVVGGLERTEAQYAELFSAAGLRLNRVVPTAHEVSVLEVIVD
jgi:SAM-dependent methyltransferase